MTLAALIRRIRQQTSRDRQDTQPARRSRSSDESRKHLHKGRTRRQVDTVHVISSKNQDYAYLPASKRVTPLLVPPPSPCVTEVVHRPGKLPGTHQREFQLTRLCERGSVRLHLKLFDFCCLLRAQLTEVVLRALELVFRDCELGLEVLVPVLQCPNASRALLLFRKCRLNTTMCRIQTYIERCLESSQPV
jgi:hypothetical protein